MSSSVNFFQFYVTDDLVCECFSKCDSKVSTIVGTDAKAYLFDLSLSLCTSSSSTDFVKASCEDTALSTYTHGNLGTCSSVPRLTVAITNVASLFKNTHSAICGAITSCELKAVGCSNAYPSSGKLSIGVLTTDVLKAQASTAGYYTETVCISCKNAKVSTITHDSF